MSEFKTNKISPRSGTTQTIGDSGDSVSTSSGSTINNAGTITTAGITGGTINNTTGSIYLRGEVDWKPSDIKTASFTATDNQGFFVNTTSGEITVTLPASPSAGDVVGIKDYANTFDTNKCILNANGNKIQGSTELFEITVEGSSIIIIYVDATQGWVITDASKAADISQVALFTVATGGTETTCGDFKIHTFTGPGTLCISQVGNCVGGPGNVDYLVVAGGGGGSTGGGGAGGYRTSYPSPAGTVPISVQGYPITVGAGGSGGQSFVGPGTSGSNSIFSSITSAGGGGGARWNNNNGLNGGSGGGASADGPSSGGTGNTPPVSPPQGNPGGNTTGGGLIGASGGGGASAAGSASSGSNGGPGGNGSANSITGSSITRAGGGGGGANACSPATPASGGTGGAGGGGNGGTNDLGLGSPGTTNTGGGGGGNEVEGPGPAGSGGSGIVIIRYKFQ
jgi:hypothetical protein